MTGITSHQKNLGENSLAVRNKLIERTANSEKIANKGPSCVGARNSSDSRSATSDIY